MRALAWFGLVMVLGCAPEAPSVVVDAPAAPDEAAPDETPPARTCEPVECLRERAEADLALGILDRASALLGRAYALEPNDHGFMITHEDGSGEDWIVHVPATIWK